MKSLGAGRTQPHKEFQRCENDAEIVELSKAGKKIRNEIDWRDDVEPREDWEHLERHWYLRLAEEPGRQPRLPEKQPQTQRARQPGREADPHSRVPLSTLSPNELT